MRVHTITAALLLGALVTVDAVAEDLQEDLQQNLRDQVVALTEQVKAEGPKFMLAGTVEPGKQTPYSINGEDFEVEDATESYGEGKIAVGQTAQVSGLILDGKKLARKIILQDSHPSVRSAPKPQEIRDGEALKEPGPLELTE